jgi:hypothetical protein
MHTLYIYVYTYFSEMSGRKRLGRPKSEVENVHVCRVCGMRFSRISNVKRHYSSIHQQARKFPCKLCSERFLTKESREQHIRERHPHSMAYRCGFCQYATNYMTELGSHVAQTHPKPLSEREQIAEEKKRDRMLKKKEKAAEKLALRKRRSGLSIATDCVHCGVHFENKEQVLHHLQTEHPMPANYMLEATAFHASCQCWVKHFPKISRFEGRTLGTRAEEKRRAVADLSKIIEAERENVKRIAGNTLQTHRLFKYCIIPFVRMSRVQLQDALGQDTRPDLEQVFKLRSQQYTASIALAEDSVQNFNAQFNTMKQLCVSRMEDQLMEDVSSIKYRHMWKYVHILAVSPSLLPPSLQGSGWVFEGVDCFHVEISQCHHRFGMPRLTGAFEVDGPEAVKEMQERLKSM